MVRGSIGVADAMMSVCFIEALRVRILAGRGLGVGTATAPPLAVRCTQGDPLNSREVEAHARCALVGSDHIAHERVSLYLLPRIASGKRYGLDQLPSPAEIRV